MKKCIDMFHKIKSKIVIRENAPKERVLTFRNNLKRKYELGDLSVLCK